MFRDDPQRHFSQCGQIALAEKILRCGRGAVGEVNFAFRQAGAELLRRQVDEDDLVRRIEHGIGNCFPNDYTGDLLDRIATALDMLDINCRENIDPCVEQLDHVLVTLRMARAGRIRVCQLVDDRDLRMPDKNRVEIHLRLGGAAIFQLRARHDRQAFEQRFRLRPPVRFNNTDHDLAAILLRLPRRLQHGERFANARAHSEKDLQLAARRSCLVAFDSRQDLVWTWCRRVRHAVSLKPPREGEKISRSRPARGHG